MNTQSIIELARKSSRTTLTEVESKIVLQEAGIDVVKPTLVTSKGEAVIASKAMGLPVALKIVSPDITHKTDLGGVRLKLQTLKQVESAYDEIMSAVKEKKPDAVIEGMSVQKMARPGVEVIIGMTKDAQFGPVLMFGLGGVMVEILKDVSFRLTPLERIDARQMIEEIKGFPLLKGYRGSEEVDIPYLEGMLLKMSEFVEVHPEIKEVDLNPVFAYSKGALAVDARIILERLD
jgi:acyl-CoA synthetase (NDP forming)